MAENSNNNSAKISEEQIINSISKRIASGGVQSVSVDGMSASYSSLKDQLEALSALQKQKASKNPLAAIKIFKVKSGN